MFKIFARSKNLLFVLSLVLLFTILLISNILSVISSENTFSSIISSTEKEAIHKDFDGDGIIDTLTVSKSGESYLVEIKTEIKDYILTNSNSDSNLVDSSSPYSIKIETIDLSRDGIPEIIISGSKNNLPITYIFKWSNEAFVEVFSSTKNIVGILNSRNSKTPEILDTNSSKGDNSTSAFIFNDSLLKDISFSTPKIPALSIIQTFIDLVQSPYAQTELPSIFSSDISSDTLSILWKLDKNNFNYNFQYGFFHDISWNSNGTPDSITWLLSFDKDSITDGNIKSDKITLQITTSSNNSNVSVISSIINIK